MKRTAISLQQIAAWPNLQAALWRAARAKRQRPEVRAFLADSDHQLQRLRQSILCGDAPRGDYRQFTIYDPKQREIHAACFADRVLHHAVMAVAGPTLERALIHDTYACLPGRGVHAAAKRAQQQLRRYPWYVKVDVAGYFPSIDHAILLQCLEQRFKGEAFLALLARLIVANGGAAGTGLPIGSLTSQHFANLYLDGADRFALEQLCVQAYVRYMDDMIWWCGSREQAKQSLLAFRLWLSEERLLNLHPHAQINRSAVGVSYCGYRISASALRLSPRRKQRYTAGRANVEQQWRLGGLSDLALQQGYDAVLAITLPAQSAGFRARNLQYQEAPDA